MAGPELLVLAAISAGTQAIIANNTKPPSIPAPTDDDPALDRDELERRARLRREAERRRSGRDSLRIDPGLRTTQPGGSTGLRIPTGTNTGSTGLRIPTP